MDLLKSHKHRSRLSELTYVVLNFSLAAMIFATTYASNAPWIGLALIVVSKWRVFAVRPRFWVANMVANMVDVLVGVSYVMFLYSLSGLMYAQIALTAVYAAWLLLIKPRSKYVFVAMQAGIALFFGLTTLSMVAYGWNVAYFVAGSWIIGYVVVRHVVSNYEEPYSGLYNLLGGLLIAEFSWISYHWMVAYPIVGAGSLRLSQFALFTTLFCFVAERAYRSYHRYGSVRRADIMPAIVLTALVVVVSYIFAAIYGSEVL